MNENLKKIQDYLIETGVKKEKVEFWSTSSVYLASEIMEYAHRNQKRENGEDYAEHPARCLVNYRNFIGIGPNGDRIMDKDLLYKYMIPFDGVQEVCLLHDVIEDTDFTIDDIREIYVECGFETYFDIHIKDALERITHDKAVDYEEYIKNVLLNPVAAMVKMMDLQDNLHVIDLIDFSEEKYHRAQSYLFWIFVINEGYHFMENAEKYRKALKEESNQ